MTVFNAQNGAIVTSGRRLTTTAETTIYTARKAALPVLDSINFCNTSASPVLITARWYKANVPTSLAIVSTRTLAANDTLLILNLPISMLDADEIRVTAGTANVIDVIVVVVENRGAGQ